MHDRAIEILTTHLDRVQDENDRLYRDFADGGTIESARRTLFLFESNIKTIEELKEVIDILKHGGYTSNY